MIYKLSELFDLQMGKTPSRNNASYWNSKENKWISIGDLSKCDIYISDTKEYISNLAVLESGIKLIPKNTVIMSFKLSIGKAAITAEDMYSNEAIMAFLDKNIAPILPEYLCYMFNYMNWEVGTNKAVLGKTLNKATLSEIKIKIHGLNEQKIIIKKLNKLKQTISARNKQLKLYDKLVKSLFVEMFGDKAHILTMNDLCNIITDGTHQSPKFVSDGIPFLFVSNVSENKISYDTGKFISIDTYKELYKRTPIEKYDILLSTVGSYGHPAIVKSNKKILFQRHIAYLKPKKELINSIYLHAAILSDEVQRQIESKVKGIAQKTLNLSEIKTLKIPLPSMTEQNIFATIVEKIDKHKSVVQKSLDETQILFDSLMQKYFG